MMYDSIGITVFVFNNFEIDLQTLYEICDSPLLVIFTIKHVSIINLLKR